MNFSPSSTSLPRLSKDGLRIQPATEILHHQPLADRSRSGRRDREFKVKDHKVSGRRDREFKVKDHKVSGRRDRGLLYIEIRETAQHPEILELQDLLQTRTATMHSHPVRLQPT